MLCSLLTCAVAFTALCCHAFFPLPAKFVVMFPCLICIRHFWARLLHENKRQGGCWMAGCTVEGGSSCPEECYSSACSAWHLVTGCEWECWVPAGCMPAGLVGSIHMSRFSAVLLPAIVVCSVSACNNMIAYFCLFLLAVLWCSHAFVLVCILTVLRCLLSGIFVTLGEGFSKDWEFFQVATSFSIF